MSLGLRLCTSREGGTGGGGWVSALSLGSMAASGCGLEKLLVGAGWAISLLLCTNGLRKQSSIGGLVGPQFLAVKCFSRSRPLGWSWVGHFSSLHKWAEKTVLSPSRASISGSEAFSRYRRAMVDVGREP